MIAVQTTSPAETREVAATVAAFVRPGDVLLLVGDLGAGKTAFAQAMGSALGVSEPITSPTFTMHNVYKGDLIVNHVDVYRIERVAEVVDLALPELVDSDSVTLIEWGDRIAGTLLADYLEIRFNFGPRDDDRTIAFRPVGASWAARDAALGAALMQEQGTSC